MGMLPKNKLRKDIMKGLIMFREPYHTYSHVGLPQFTEPMPLDINEIYGFPAMEREATTITYASDPNNIPEELKNLSMELDPQISAPENAKTKVGKFSKKDILMSQKLR